MMCKRRFVIDPGKNTVKYMIVAKDGSIERMGSFESKSKQLESFNQVQGGGASTGLFRVEFDGAKYVVGDKASDKYDQSLTKMTEHHKLVIYTVLGQLAEEGEMIYLVTGCPSDEFVNEDKPKEYKEYLRNEGKTINIKVNGVEKNFQIAHVDVHTEGMCIVPRSKLGKGEGYHIVDIGGQNVNYRNYNANGTATGTSLSLDEAGVNHVANQLKIALKQTLKNVDGVSIHDIDFMNTIDLGYIKNSAVKNLTGYKDSSEFVSAKVVQFINTTILDGLEEYGIKLRAKGKKIICTGGGSLKLRKYIERAITENTDNLYFSETAKWDNCLSYILKTLADAKNGQAFQAVLKQAESPNLEEEKDPNSKTNRLNKKEVLEEVAATEQA